MSNSKEDKIDAFTAFLGFVLGYSLFAGFLLLYERVAAGGLDFDDFTVRMMTPFSLRLRWTDFVCYGLIALGIGVIAKLQDQP